MEWIELFKNEIKGEFSFMLFEFKDNKLLQYFVGRDMVGVRPLYMSQDNNELDMYSSEIKGYILNRKLSDKEFKPSGLKKAKKELTVVETI